jgi:hypothetical protein
MTNTDQIIRFFNERDKRRKQKRNNILVFASTLFVIVLVVGIIGYMSLFNLEFTDAVYNTVLVLTAIDTPNPGISSPQKVFIILFALISTILLLSIVISAIDAIIDGYIDS